MKMKTKKAFFGYLFFSPWIIGFIFFTAYPFFYSLYLSFFNVKFKSTGIESTFVGLKHYLYAFRGDINFPIALTDTLINIILSVPLILIFSLIIAILLNSQIKARAFFRLLYFLPVVIISGPVVSELVSNNAARIVDPGKYFIYKFFTTLPDRISFPFLYMFDNLVLILWFSGVQIIFFLAGLQKINSSVYEAAKIDGANSWIIFWKITLPLIRPFILVNAIYTIMELASFANNSINGVITMHMFDIDKPYSYSSALSWIYFISIAIIIAITYLLLKERRRV
ncbi:sugar ABC transporter permease [Marinitoga sp. 38H-ov]|uniref:carbohydrate ABC transporter permease n=1 Tax=Marinitoga sp. 38H-ov TaxID=1755814 RepID=UPI0013ED9493|nr:sugar ABC transporter permease [Marinitoga sp. 38H-ov]